MDEFKAAQKCKRWTNCNDITGKITEKRRLRRKARRRLKVEDSMTSDGKPYDKGGFAEQMLEAIGGVIGVEREEAVKAVAERLRLQPWVNALAIADKIEKGEWDV